MKKNQERRIRQYAIVPTLLAVSMSYATHAFAVQGGVVTAGSGSINTRGNNTTVSQTSDRMVVNWANFDIARNQAVNFNQPNSNSAVLNRITNAAPTQIDGSLTANGRVFVVNPAGVMFGKTAKVDVGSLVASALDVRENEFMNGGSVYSFYGKRGVVFYGSSSDTATVSNDGKLTAREEVVLMGPQVVNRGTIRARDVTLASAQGAALNLEGSKFSIQLGQRAKNALAANSGTISANGGDVRLTTAATGALVGAVIQNTGSIEATKATSGQGGSVILGSNYEGPVSVGGRITANNIQIAADSPAFADNPTDWRMQQFGSGLDSATRDVTVESGARLKADSRVDISALDAKINVNGRIDGGDVWVDALGGSLTVGDRITGRNVKLGGTGVVVNAAVQATNDLTVQADPWNKGNNLEQNANVQSAHGNVSLSGTNVIQAAGTKTIAGGDVRIQADNRGGQVDVANVSGRNVSINGALLNLNGNVKAQDAITVLGVDLNVNGKLTADKKVELRAASQPVVCQPDSCSAPYYKRGTITQNGQIKSANGDVSMDAILGINQAASSRTTAANSILLQSTNVHTNGVNTAVNAIDIDASRGTLKGTLKAAQINLPRYHQITLDKSVKLKGKVDTKTWTYPIGISSM